MAETAILLLAHGTPETLDDIPEYLRNVTSGRPMPEAVVAEIRHRYGLDRRQSVDRADDGAGTVAERDDGQCRCMWACATGNPTLWMW